jgi:hypothetical protein
LATAVTVAGLGVIKNSTTLLPLLFISVELAVTVYVPTFFGAVVLDEYTVELTPVYV